jgi:hypothetical protein
MTMPRSTLTNGSTISAAHAPVEPRFEHAAHGLSQRAAPRAAPAPVVRAAQQRRVGIAKERHVGDEPAHQWFRRGTHAADATNSRLASSAPVAPGMRAHLECDLHRTGTIAGEKGMAERLAVKRGRALGQGHRRRVRAASQHHVRQGVELLLDGVADAFIASDRTG